MAFVGPVYPCLKYVGVCEVKTEKAYDYFYHHVFTKKTGSLTLFRFLRSLNFNLFFNRPEDFMIRELQAAEEEKAKAVRKALNKKNISFLFPT